MQKKPHHSPWLKSEYHGDIYNEKPMVVQMEKKRCITADDDPIRCEIYVS
jgi:hypothetical protein